MRSSLLCPVYRKWLQLHPQQARIERQKLKHQALQLRRAGNMSRAGKLYTQVWEIAQSILFSLRQPANHSALYRQDLVNFVAAAMAVNHCFNAQSELSQRVLTDTQQQLSALMPLYASEPNLLTTIRQLKVCIQSENIIQPSPNLH